MMMGVDPVVYVVGKGTTRRMGNTARGGGSIGGGVGILGVILDERCMEDG